MINILIAFEKIANVSIPLFICLLFMVNSCDNSFTLNFLKYVQSPLCNKHLITLIECFNLHIFMSRLDSLLKKCNAGNVQLDDIPN